MTATGHHEAAAEQREAAAEQREAAAEQREAAPGHREATGRRGTKEAGGRARHRGAWIAVAIIGALGIVVPCVFSLVAGAISRTDRYVGPDNGRAHPVTAVEVDAGVSRITVTSGPAGHVTVNGSFTWSMKRPVVEQTWDGDTLKLKTRCTGFVDRYLQNCQVDLDLAVPTGVSLKVHGGSGEIKVHDLAGPVDLHGGSGGIKLYGLKGPVRASVGSGELQAVQLASPNASLEAGSGTIDADFATAPQHVEADTGSGSVDITVPQGARYRVTGHSGSGGRSIQDELIDSGSDRVIDATTGSGSVDIGYPGH
ncbi:DUF4097 family beta strand repeat-containing protein [Streptomyces sp. NPDC048491]|uniref:DUF4097 family beta strand repeat-containing protein n=1 Tax=Streptomyces sp. NPDC048491 TaxID=3157207 RepID=UPI00343FE9FF